MPTATALAPEPVITVKTVQDTYLDCRVVGHWWNRTQDDGRRLKAWHNTRELRRKVFHCMNCGMKRYDVWNRLTGMVDARAYLPPPDYKISGQPEKWVLRKEALSRWDD